MCLNAGRLVASERATNRLVNGHFHLLLLGQGEEKFVESKGIFQRVLWYAMASEVEEPVCVACITHSLNDILALFVRGCGGEESADVDGGDCGLFGDASHD
jgi:hypothetical protein